MDGWTNYVSNRGMGSRDAYASKNGGPNHVVFYTKHFNSQLEVVVDLLVLMIIDHIYQWCQSFVLSNGQL